MWPFLGKAGSVTCWGVSLCVHGGAGTGRWNQEFLQREKVTQFGLSSKGNVSSVFVQQQTVRGTCSVLRQEGGKWDMQGLCLLQVQ